MVLFKNSNIRAAAGGGSDPASRAARGAAHLDAVRPGWHHRVDTDTLNIASGGRCALGQVYGSYGAGLTQGHVGSAAPSFGMVAMTSNIDAEYRALTEAWVREVENRRVLVTA